MQRYLDSRYTQNDVRHTFKTKFGEQIDCIDFYAQPGVKKLAARGMKIASIPQLAPLAYPVKPASASWTTEDLSFNGQRDQDGNPRACPAGTVPQLRITAEQIARVGGLDAFLAAHRKTHGIRPKPPNGADSPGYAHVVMNNATNSSSITSGSATLTMATPPLSSSTPIGDHSLAQTWIAGGGGTVEAGWTVDRSLSGDTQTHIFIFSTSEATFNADGSVTYGNGCYDNEGDGCVPWVALPSSFAPGQTISPVSTAGGSQVELAITSKLTSDGWVISMCIGYTCSNLGYYPKSNYSATGMGAGASTFQAGGEVFDQAAKDSNSTDYSKETWDDPPAIRMGLGNVLEGYGISAIAYNLSYTDKVGTHTDFYPSASQPGSYHSDQSMPGPYNETNFTYFGDVTPKIPGCAYSNSTAKCVTQNASGGSSTWEVYDVACPASSNNVVQALTGGNWKNLPSLCANGSTPGSCSGANVAQNQFVVAPTMDFIDSAKVRVCTSGPECGTPFNLVLPVCVTPDDLFYPDVNDTPLQITQGGTSVINLLLVGSWIKEDSGVGATGKVVSNNLPSGNTVLLYPATTGYNGYPTAYAMMEMMASVPQSTPMGNYSLKIQGTDLDSKVALTTLVPIQVIAGTPPTPCQPLSQASACSSRCGTVTVPNGCGGTIQCVNATCSSGMSCSSSYCCKAGTVYNNSDGFCEPTSCPAGTAICPATGTCMKSAICNKINNPPCQKVNGKLECQ
ncbi:MAG: neprosin family prolyl endopeptidase [Terracidiphilus sp.]